MRKKPLKKAQINNSEIKPYTGPTYSNVNPAPGYETFPNPNHNTKQTWEGTTGTDWSVARDLGYTDNSREANLKLLNDLTHSVSTGNPDGFDLQLLKMKMDQARQKRQSNVPQRRNGGGMLSNFKSAARFDQPNFKNGRRGIKK
jgi:hypothetical protein